jgi:hypothetical protein
LVIRVYCDGAGKEKDHPVITVGGFLADEAICEDIERDWHVATGGRVFRLADFGTAYCELGSGDWPDIPLTFRVLDRSSTEFFGRHPEVLKKRLKQSPYKPPKAAKP